MHCSHVLLCTTYRSTNVPTLDSGRQREQHCATLLLAVSLQIYATVCFYLLPYLLLNVCTPWTLGGSMCNPTTAFSSKPERKEQILQIAAVFLRLAIFQGADRRKQNICRRDFVQEERHLPHFKYLICCFSCCSQLQHWFKVKAYTK